MTLEQALNSVHQVLGSKLRLESIHFEPSITFANRMTIVRVMQTITVAWAVNVAIIPQTEIVERELKIAEPVISCGKAHVATAKHDVRWTADEVFSREPTLLDGPCAGLAARDTAYFPDQSALLIRGQVVASNKCHRMIKYQSLALFSDNTSEQDIIRTKQSDEWRIALVQQKIQIADRADILWLLE
ncbi:MAG: hypothetical protein NVS9B10_05250 [Nevskia sp.]